MTMKKILLLADIHQRVSVLKNLENFLPGKNFDAILVAGDLTDRNAEALDYAKKFEKIIKANHLKFFFIHGNGDAPEVTKYFTEKGYSIHLKEKKLDKFKIIGIGGFGEEHPQKFDVTDSIFITHFPPIFTPLEVPSEGGASRPWSGLLLTGFTSKKFKDAPLVHIFGHTHFWEYKRKHGKTLLVQLRAASFGRAGILELPSLKLSFLSFKNGKSSTPTRVSGCWINKERTNLGNNRTNLLLSKYLLLLKRYKVPKGIITHSLGVCKVSCFLVRKLKEKGFYLDEDIVVGGSLLHDVDKIITRSFNHHGKKIKELLKKEKLNPKIFLVAQYHQAENIFDKNFFKLPLEIKVVFYADKIFEQKICSIEERIASWQDRLKKAGKKDVIANYEKTERMIRKMKELEEELLKKAGISFKDIKREIEKLN